ncbi:MAG: transcription termination/antitermination protein NusG, partial [Lentisphaeria bacterium]
ETWLPMFRGYLFVQLSSEHYRLLASCCKVAHILSINQGEEKQLVEELRDIQRMEEISCSRDITVKPEIEAGQLVQVSCGPLQGTTGIVKKRGGRMRVTVNLEILGQSVSTDLDIGEVDVCTY